MAITVYMVLGPSHALHHAMQLTHMSMDFKLEILGLGAAFLAVSWLSEHYVFHKAAKAIGWARFAITKEPKKRKEYKVIQERMKI